MSTVPCPRCDAPSAEALCPVCRYPVVPERVRESRKQNEYGDSLLEFETIKQINVARRYRAFCRDFLAYILMSLAFLGISAWIAALKTADPSGPSTAAALIFGGGFLVLSAVSLILFVSLLRLLGSLELGVFLPLALFLFLFFNQGSIFFGMIVADFTDAWILFLVCSLGVGFAVPVLVGRMAASQLRAAGWKTGFFGVSRRAIIEAERELYEEEPLQTGMSDH